MNTRIEKVEDILNELEKGSELILTKQGDLFLRRIVIKQPLKNKIFKILKEHINELIID